MENNYLINPHDKFFKESFSYKDTTESFVKEYLPEAISKQIDFTSLEIIKDSFIDKELSEHFSDILYQARIAGKNSYLYFLFEHKSYEDPYVFFQLLRNMVKVWEQYLKQNPSSKKLPVIVPIIIYHGDKIWSITNSIATLFDVDADVSSYVPDFKSEIFDVSHIPDDTIRGETILRVHFLIEKYIQTPQFIEKVPEIFTILMNVVSDNRKTKYIETVLRYLTATVEKENKQKLKEELIKVLEKGDNIMSTIAEEWIKEGEARARVETKIEDAQKMIQIGMNDESIHYVTGLPMEQIAEIRRNLKRE